MITYTGQMDLGTTGDITVYTAQRPNRLEIWCNSVFHCGGFCEHPVVDNISTTDYGFTFSVFVPMGETATVTWQYLE